jgi:putative ABC transport system substrate-binding protein
LIIVRIEARNASSLPQAFAAIAASDAQAVYLLDDPVLAGTSEVRKQIVEWALSRGLPVVSSNSSVVTDGGLASLGTDRQALARRAALYVDRILKGAKPADLPVERPSVFKLSVNVNPAKGLGLVMPQALLLRADEVIQ